MSSAYWLVICGVGALLMRLGVALRELGMVRSKNSAGSLLRQVADLCVVSLSFWLIGQRILAYPGESGWRMWEVTAFRPASLFFTLAILLVGSAIVSGIVAERARFMPMLAASLLLGGIAMPLTLRWIRPGGWLGSRGYHDVASIAVVHLVPAIFGAVAAILMGPRMGKYNRDGSSNAIPGHNVPVSAAGTLVTLIAWFPYVLGFSGPDTDMGRISLNILLAASAGGLASLLLGQFRYGKPDIHLTYAGMIGALVAISAAADSCAHWVAVLLGAFAGVIVPILTLIIDLVWRIDDPSGAIAVHGGGAILGILAAAFIVPAGSFSQRLSLLGIQVLAVVVVAALAMIVSLPWFFFLKARGMIRASEADEFDGLDLAEHDIGAYPDFQQNTIKSYHLREA